MKIKTLKHLLLLLFFFLITSNTSAKYMVFYDIALIQEDIIIKCNKEESIINGIFTFTKLGEFKRRGKTLDLIPEGYVIGIYIPIYVPNDFSDNKSINMSVLSEGKEIKNSCCRPSPWDKYISLHKGTKIINFILSIYDIKNQLIRSEFEKKYKMTYLEYRKKYGNSNSQLKAIHDSIEKNPVYNFKIRYIQPNVFDKQSSHSVYTPIIPKQKNGLKYCITFKAMDGCKINLITTNKVIKKNMYEIVIEPRHLEKIVVKIINK